MNPNSTSVWKAPIFCAAISAVTVAESFALLVFTVPAAHGGTTFVGMIPFICFMPMAFWIGANAQKQTRDHIAALEARIKQLEESGT